jgi:hypothetical protein
MDATGTSFAPINSIEVLTAAGDRVTARVNARANKWTFTQSVSPNGGGAARYAIVDVPTARRSSARSP